MRTIGRVLLVGLGLMFSLPPLRAHPAPPPNALGLSTDQYDLLLAALEQTTPTPAEDIPRDAALYSAQNPAWAPLPMNANNLPAWNVGEFWILADENFDYSSAAASAPGQASAQDDPVGEGGPAPAGRDLLGAII